MRSLVLCALALAAGCIATPPPPRPGGPADPAAPEGPVAPAPAALRPFDGGDPAAAGADGGMDDMAGMQRGAPDAGSMDDMDGLGSDGGTPRKRRKKQGQGHGDTQADGGTR